MPVDAILLTEYCSLIKDSTFIVIFAIDL